jgi:UDP-N-acetylglucosamine--N-acetylmuramyl-(pentapeptide) pyrophosphoryl-undecaprenol N-acetylglucosamine transferase
VSAFAVVTGGGTAGHVLPALAISEALVARGHESGSIHYVGAWRGIETKLLPETPFAHTFFDVVGFQRSFSRRNIGFVPKMLSSRRRAIGLFRRLQPKVVVSVGGYASMPAVFAARKLGVPVVVVSFDRALGRASKLALRGAAACAVAFPDSPIPNATVTGAPIRQAIFDIDRSRDRAMARSALGVPDDRFMVAVMGGSQGSGVLNDAIWRWVRRSKADTGLAIRHAVGERFLADAPIEIGDDDSLIYHPVGYEPQMPLIYAAADLLIGRGGASTVHEVAVTGIPAVLVPWANAAEDHQTGNVGWLADGGGAIYLPETDIDGLETIIGRLRSDPRGLDALSDRALEFGSIHRSGALAQLIESVALT